MLDPVRWSHLRAMRQSPAHYRYSLTAPRVESAAMRLGSAVHSLVFGTDAFDVWEGVRRGKDWEAFRDHRERLILNTDEAGTANDIYQSIMRTPEAVRVLTGDQERRIEWTEAERACAGTPDVIGTGFISDLKITNDASPERFPYHARKMAWNGQVCWYRNGYARFTGLDTSEFDLYLVAAESKPPHPVTVFRLTPSAIDMGDRIWRYWFERLLVCEASDSWPGYTSAVVPLDAIEDFTLSIDGEEVEA